MAVAEGELHDAKAGYSSYCRCDEHAGCRSAQAKCSCTCHGRNGQAGPAPVAKIPVVLTKVSTFGTSEIECDQCGRRFAGNHGLQVHKARSHKATPAKPKVSTPVLDDDSAEPLWILVVIIDGPDAIRLEGLSFPTEQDAERVREFLAKLGQPSNVMLMEGRQP